MPDSSIQVVEAGTDFNANVRSPQKQDVATTVCVHSDWDSVEAVRKLWSDWQFHPNTDPEFVKFIVGVRPECERPYVVALHKNQGITALLVGRAEVPHVTIKIGYLHVARPKLRIITFLHGGVLGSLDTQSSDAVVKTVLDRISAGDADAAYFEHVRQDSPLAESLRKVPGVFRRDAVLSAQPHHSMLIPESADAFYASLSPKVRKNQKWQARKLCESFSQKVEVRSYTRREDLNLLFEDVDQIARTTYQRGLGVGFIDTPETRGRMQLSADNGWLHAFVLYLAGKPSAFWIGTRYRNRFFSDFMGYDAAHAKYSPGMYLVLKGIEQFCEEKGSERISEIDFGLGDAQYKQVLATDSWMEQSFYVYSTSARGTALNLSRALSGIVDRSARTLLRKLNLENTIKNNWRRRLAKK